MKHFLKKIISSLFLIFILISILSIIYLSISTLSVTVKNINKTYYGKITKFDYLDHEVQGGEGSNYTEIKYYILTEKGIFTYTEASTVPRYSIGSNVKLMPQLLKTSKLLKVNGKQVGYRLDLWDLFHIIVLGITITVIYLFINHIKHRVKVIKTGKA